MFFWRRVAPQIPEEGLKPTATPGYTRNFRDLNRLVSQGKSFSGYERNPLFLNLEGKGFADVGGLLGVDYDDDARAVASMDWDRDGDLDLWVTNRTAPRVRLLKNNLSSSNTFVAIRLTGNGSTTNRDAIGARLTLWSASQPDLKQTRTVRAGDGFLSQSSRWIHFGLGSTDDDLQLTVAWPGGETESFSGLRSNARYAIVQGEGQLGDPLPSLAQVAVESVAEEAPSESGMGGFRVANRVPFPKLVYTDPEGVSRSTTEHLGKPLLVQFWATWCAPCLHELAEFGKHADAIRSRGVTILALNVDGLKLDGGDVSTADPQEVLERAGYNLPHGVARQENLAKVEVLVEYLSSRRMPLSLPTSFLVDAEGNVAAVYLESVRWAKLETDLAFLNASPATQLNLLSPRTGRWFADPRDVDRDAYLGDYATLFAKSGLSGESQRLFQILKAQGGAKSAQDFYNQAKSAARQGNTKQAVAFYREAIRLQPDYGQALTGLGALLLMQRRLDEAEALFEKALTVDPNHATALVNLAMIDQSRGNKQRARERLETVVARNPGYAEALLNLGSLLASMKEHDEAIRHLSRAVELNPKRAVAHLNLAAAYLETRQWEKSAEHYRQAQTLNVRDPYPHFGFGRALASQGNHADAVKSFRKALSLGAKNATLYTQLGLSLSALGQKQAAEEALKAALRLDPEHGAAIRAIQDLGSERPKE